MCQTGTKPLHRTVKTVLFSPFRIRERIYVFFIFDPVLFVTHRTGPFMVTPDTVYSIPLFFEFFLLLLKPPLDFSQGRVVV